MSNIYHTLLIERGITSNYAVWMSKDWHEWTLIELLGDASMPTPNLPDQVPIVAPMSTRSDGGFMSLFIPYADNVCLALCFYGSYEPTVADWQMLSSMLYPYYAESLVRKHEISLNRMINSIRDISQLIDLDELLNRILVNALSVIPYECFGVLWKYEETSNELVVKARAGGLGEGMLRMRIKPGEGIIGKIFQRGVSRLYTLPEQIYEDYGDMSEENTRNLVESYAFERMRSIIAVPIKMDGQVECVLIVYQNGYAPLLTESDMLLLQGFSDQVAIAMTNAKLFEDVRRQNRLLRKRDEIHASLMKLSFQHKGAISVVTELTRMIGLPITFVDLLEGEWYPKRKKEPGGWAADKLRKLFMSTGGPVYRPNTVNNGNSLYYLYPIAPTHDCLGYLIIELSSEMEALSLIALEQGSSVLAVELLRKKSMSEIRFKTTQEAFNDLLLIKDAADYKSKAMELGIQVDTSIFVCMVELLPNHKAHGQREMSYTFVISLMNKLSPHTAILAFGNGNKVTVVLADRKGKDRDAALEEFRAFLSEWGKQEEGRVRAGAGSAYADSFAVQKSYEEAKKALAYQKSKGQMGLIRYLEIGVNRLFIGHESSELDAFMNEIFEPLQASNGTSDLEATLLAYISCGCSAAKTAEQLHIHINTLYQRIRKIEDILQLSFADHENALRLNLACYLRQSRSS